MFHSSSGSGDGICYLSASRGECTNGVSAALQLRAYSVKHRFHEFEFSILNLGKSYHGRVDQILVMEMNLGAPRADLARGVFDFGFGGCPESRRHGLCVAYPLPGIESTARFPGYSHD